MAEAVASPVQLPEALEFLRPVVDEVYKNLTLPIVFSTVATICVLNFVWAYILLLLVTHHPRPETASEKTYITANEHGQLPAPLPLPDTLDETVAPEVLMSVVVPAYNEELRITEMLDECVEFLREEYGEQSPLHPTENGGISGITVGEGNGSVRRKSKKKQANGNANGHLNGGATASQADDELRGWEILIVDDGSKDKTTEVVLKWMRQRVAMGHMRPGDLRICHLEKNRGKGGAVTHGMRHIRGRYAVFADADGATKFSDLRTLLSKLKRIESSRPSPTSTTRSEHHAIAVGSRAHMVNSSAVVERAWYRNILMYGFHTFLHVIGIKKIKDTQCGFKLFTRDTARLVFWECHCEGWIFDIEVLLVAEAEGVDVEEVSVTWHEVEGTKMSLVRDSLKMAWDLVVVRAAYLAGVYGGDRKRWRKGSPLRR